MPPPVRDKMAVAGWKMAMTIGESLAFVERFPGLVGAALDVVDVCLFPPFTALWAVSNAARNSGVEIGGQNVADTEEPARTGQVSARLLVDAGCVWVQLGHWEVRRYLGDDDATVNRKVHLALAAGLKCLVLIGEARASQLALQDEIVGQLDRMLAGCRPDQVAEMALMYEPEVAIGLAAPAQAQHVEECTTLLRRWVGDRFGSWAADRVRVLYGGSVSPDRAPTLLNCANVDGLGAGRQGRNPDTFAAIVRTIALHGGG